MKPGVVRARIIAQIESLPDIDRQSLIREILVRFHRPWSSTERSRLTRSAKPDASVASNRTPALQFDDVKVDASVASKATPSLQTSGTSSFLRFYSEQFELLFSEKPSINFGKDGAITKKLLAQYGEEKLRGLLQDFFKSGDNFIVKSGHTIGVFSSVINKLIVARSDPNPRSFSGRLWDEAQAEKGQDGGRR